jgi:hypothetical protein
MLNRRQRREFEQKAAKETKAHWGLGFRDGHPVGPSAPLRSSSPSLRSRRTRSRAAYRAEPTEWPPQQACACRHADTGPCVRATPLRHRGRLENRRIAEGPTECPWRKPNPQCVFVSFAAFCSNFLRCLLSSIDPSGSSGAAKLDADSPIRGAAFGCTI